MTESYYQFWTCKDCGWASHQRLTYKYLKESDKDKPSTCPKCGSAKITRQSNSLMMGVKTYTDEKGRFSVKYPYIRNWLIQNKGPGVVVFANMTTRAMMALMSSQLPIATADPWDIGTQVQVVKGLAFTLKQIFKQGFANHKIVSTEKITNSNNQAKGFEILTTFFSRDKPIKAKCLTFIQNQNKYDIIATAEEQNFRTADIYFFRPVIENFEF